MSIAEKLTTVAENVSKVYEAGQKAEYDKFWDEYQNRGGSRKYQYGFACGGWNDVTFKPKYNIICAAENNGGMFTQSRITDLEKILNDCNVILDTTKSTNLDNMFLWSFVTAVPTLNTTNSGSVIYSTFNNAQYLKTIRKLILKDDGSQGFSSVFANCKALENITIEGTIGQSGFNVQWSTKLSGESIVSIIEALSDTTSGLTVTLSQTAVDNMTFPITGNKGTYNSWTDLEQTKTNWTISLV